MTPRSVFTALGVAVLAVVLSACAGPATSAPPSSPASASAEPEAPSTSSPAPAVEQTPRAELSCETMISPGTVDALTAAGWTAQPKEFVAGGVNLTDGLLCFWADYSVASDHGQLYGWAPISDADAAKAQAGLLAEGWRREEAPEGVYITEDPQFSMGTDEDGYGMTYLFGDGWVKFADTRQSVVLVDVAG